MKLDSTTLSRAELTSRDARVFQKYTKLAIFTVRKRSLRRLCFYKCLSFCPQRWGCLDPGPGERLECLARRGVSRPRPRRGGGGGGLARGWCPGPDLWWGECIPAFTEADTPPPADGYCCGQYASYWNAFLRHFILLRFESKLVKFYWNWFRLFLNLFCTKNTKFANFVCYEKTRLRWIRVRSFRLKNGAELITCSWCTAGILRLKFSTSTVKLGLCAYIKRKKQPRKTLNHFWNLFAITWLVCACMCVCVYVCVCYYLATKFREGNVISRVCLYVQGVLCDHYPWYIGHHSTGPL